MKKELMNKKMLSWIALMVFLGCTSIKAQDTVSQKNTADTVQTEINSMHLRPVLLKKGVFLTSLSIDLPHYYKWYSPKTEKPEKLSSKLVMNEAYFTGYATYGLSDRINLFLTLPVVTIHHYSPMGIKSGTGFGDIETGADFGLVPLEKDNCNSLSGRITVGFPTGRYKNLSKTEYPTGLGSFRFQGTLSGLHRFKKVDMIYAAYYEYRTNHSGMHVGDETGAYLLFQKSFPTTVGNFGLETGAYTYWQFKNTKNGKEVPNSEDYAIDLYVGGWYHYLKNFYLRFCVPYSIYQNQAWITKYQVKIQFDYLFK